MSINDVVIHVNETLDTQARRDLEDRIRGIDGVIAPRFNDHTPHLMVVAYDPSRVRTKTLLDAVLSQGFHAQHCGA